MSNEELNLTQKLIKAQAELIAPKGNFNSFGKYKYRSAEDILEAVKPINAKQGLLLLLTDEPIEIDGWHYIKALAQITDGTDTIAVSAYARESEIKKGMDSAQVTGATSSYARKYALNGLYLIDDTQDADTDAYTQQTKSAPKQAPKKTQTPKPKESSSSQQAEIEKKAKEYIKIRETGTISQLMDYLKISDLKLITSAYADKSIKTLDAMIEKAEKDKVVDELNE